MKKTIFSGIVLVSLIAVFVALPVFAAGKSAPAGKSKTAHLYLYEKNPSDWSIVKKGAWGKMTYKTAGPEFKFAFNGKKLEPNTDYSLIYYPDPWPGNNLIVLGSATSKKSGNVHIQGSVDIGDLPIASDFNSDSTKTTHEYTGLTGAKIWLVKSSDIATSGTPHMTGWNPTKYLFENNLITFTKVTK